MVGALTLIAAGDTQGGGSCNLSQNFEQINTDCCSARTMLSRSMSCTHQHSTDRMSNQRRA